jgi:2-dehydropantoate 2-reductase
MTDAPRVAVLGAGAVGCYYGGMLARAGVPVTLIGRASHVEAIRRHGLRLQTTTFDEHVPVDAHTDASAVAGASLVLCCVKSPDTEAAADAMAPHLAPQAWVLSLQNGVDNAARLQARLAAWPGRVWPAVVYVAAGMAGPGHVKHNGRGELVIGPLPASASASASASAAPGEADVAALVALFARAGVPVEVSGNVLGALWGKLVLNCAYNALSALSRLPYGELVQRDGVKAVMRDTVDECLAVAAASGVTIPGDVDAAVARIAATMPGQFSSTAQDLMAGKPTEIDHLNGFVAREGARLGVPTPVNRTLWTLVTLVDRR